MHTLLTPPFYLFTHARNAVSVEGGVDLMLNGSNFLHPEVHAAECVFFSNVSNVDVPQSQQKTPSEYVRVPARAEEADCDECPARDEFDRCLVIRTCRAMHCTVPPAPNLLAQPMIVELSFGPLYPLTAQRLRMYYFTVATVTGIDVSAGPFSGGTNIIVSGTDFINAPSVYCQFGGGAEFSFMSLYSPARYISTEKIMCTVPPCSLSRIVASNSPTCPGTCTFCAVKVRVTMNERDLIAGEPDFLYRPTPRPSRVFPVRAPAAMSPTSPVTIVGADFSAVGSSTVAGPITSSTPLGLSCRFGDLRVPASLDASCSAANSTCGVINCVPPASNRSVGVTVSVAIDGQQFVPLNGSRTAFWYYR
jgi:hypothetical protein